MPRKKSTFGTVVPQKSGRYSARYPDLSGNRHSIKGTFATKPEAWAALAAVQTDLARGAWIDPYDGEILFADFAEMVAKARENELRPRTQRENGYMLKALNKTFGKKSLNKISPKDVAMWWSANAATPVGRRNKYGLLSNIMRTAVEWEYIAKSPVHVKNGFKDVSKKRPVWSTMQFERVVQHLDPELQRAMRVLYSTHLRISEVCGLNWSDWDSKENVLSVLRQADREHTAQTVDVKTGEDGQKAITPLCMGIAALHEQQQARPGIGGAAIFRGPKGGRLRARHLGNKWRDACAAEGIANFHVHDVRHTSLTAVGQNTKSLSTVKDRGGHTTVQAAMRYQAATREADRAAVQATDAALLAELG
ncbi:tyrosine-type recombinase/integrase [Amnibacterium kyonggiense]|uniref:Phage integrase family protein n=1 Tax=Amnibacterium kyonggiense TaxID=595671 RepID=A0A4R7FTI2_9MICO|nr:tyrosine-type recombinase/integrase [Amnibacterium kyonggiense]TDS81108.1 phage integrase family protein [Amnibacterium kyonggiense]